MKIPPAVNNSYPEHEKLKAISRESQVIGEFLNWLTIESRYSIAMWRGDQLSLVNVTVHRLLAEFFGIDEDKIEAEKRAMIEEIRSTLK